MDSRIVFAAVALCAGCAARTATMKPGPTTPPPIAGDLTGQIIRATPVSHPDPHLPASVRAGLPVGTEVIGEYKVCVGLDGRVFEVTPLHSIPGGDEAIMEQIRSGWTYQPMPAKFCIKSQVRFRIVEEPAP
jgi:hypothetical protein